MSTKHVTVSLQFDVTFPVDAKDKIEAEQIAEKMHLSDFLEWSTCASYNMEVLEVSEDES